MAEENEIDVTGMDDAALDAAINAEEGQPAEEPAPAEEPEPAAPEPEPTGEPETPDNAEPPTPTEEQQELERLRKQVNDKEQFIQRRNQELGELRRQLEALQPQQLEDVNDKFFENPQEAIQQILEQRDKAQKVQELRSIIQVRETETTVKGLVPDFDDLMDDMAAIAKEDGLPTEAIEVFKRNPYSEHPAFLVAFAQRAKANRELKALREENAKLKTRPDEVLKKVEQAARQSTTLTGQSGQSSQKGEISEKQVHLMTDAELDELLNS